MIAGAMTLREGEEYLAQPDIPFRNDVIPGALPVGLDVVYGPTGVHKTHFAVDISVRVASGTSWAGRKVRSGLVLYVAPEDRNGVIVRALAAARALIGAEGPALPIAIAFPACAITDPAFHPAVVASARHFERLFVTKTALIVFDTLGAGFEGESLNDDRPMTIATGNCLRISDELECAVLLVSHSGKDQSRGERGSKVLRDRATATIELSARKHHVTATIRKMRNGPVGAAFEFTTRPFAVTFANAAAIETLIVDSIREAGAPAASQGAASKKLPKDTAAAMETIRRVAVSGIASVRAWRSAFVTELSDRGVDAQRQAVSTARKNLLARGLIEIDGDTIRICEPECENSHNSSHSRPSGERRVRSRRAPKSPAAHAHAHTHDGDPALAGVILKEQRENSHGEDLL
jgi:putative DNA primase/helicase